MKKSLLILLFLLSPFCMFPCGWDWDTVQMEKQQFPQIHELITGKFYRHSQELYYWRVKNRTELLKKYPDSLHYYDDLAMAYDKIGKPGKAIEIMLQKEKKKPGLYETYANLGLFYMHNKEMKNGVQYVEKALKVNPDAHFGREKYQLHLGNYILQQMEDGKPQLPLAKGYKTGFYEYLAKHEFKSKNYTSDAHFKELSDAIKGVAGMMTFANYRSPVLLEALADLLLHTNSHRGAGHLASRAYLKASWETTGETAKLYMEKAKWAREHNYAGFPEAVSNIEAEKRDPKGQPVQDSITGDVPAYPLFRMDQLETALKYEVQLAEIWFDSIRKNEIKWIKQGLNPDSAFAKQYYENRELKNKMVEVYGTPAVAGKVRNDVWLKQQLSKPVDINSIHGHNALNDSVAKMLDEIYEKEFAVKEMPENIPEQKNEGPQPKPGNASYVTRSLTVFVVLMCLLVGWRIYKANRK